MLTRRALLDEATERLAAAGVEDARRSAEWMLEEAAGVSRVALLAQGHEPVTDEERDAFEEMLARRLRREPLQYVIGHADFYGLRLAVDPAVLIPRPETEEVVEEALRQIAGFEAPWVLDVGTGSGAIALAIKHERPDAEVFACDVSTEALGVAARNADRLGLEVTFIHGDALAPAFADGVPGCFDAIVSNPPYVPDEEAAALAPEVRDHEPGLALFTGPDPLRFFRAIAGHATRILKPGGRLVFECHTDHAPAVERLLGESGFADVALKADLARRPRIVSGGWPSPAQMPR